MPHEFKATESLPQVSATLSKDRGDGEPVAFRARLKRADAVHREWQLVRGSPEGWSDNWEIEPLYVRPAASGSPDVDAVWNEAVEAAAVVAETDTRSKLAKDYNYITLAHQQSLDIASAIRALKRPKEGERG